MDFTHIGSADHDEQIRAYCIEKAIESSHHIPPQRLSGENLITRAEMIENFIRNGKKDAE